MHIYFEQRAEEAATCLADELWCSVDRAEPPAREICPRKRYPRFVREVLGIWSDVIEEINRAIRQLSVRAMAGPYEASVDLFTLNSGNALLSKWWRGDDLQEEVLRARIVIIFQKGG